MNTESSTPLDPAYLRLQANRCQRLSRSSMDLVTARELRLMSEEAGRRDVPSFAKARAAAAAVKGN